MLTRRLLPFGRYDMTKTGLCNRWVTKAEKESLRRLWLAPDSDSVRKRTAIVAGILLFVDILFVARQLLSGFVRSLGYEAGLGIFSHPKFNVSADGGIPEIFNYLKLALASYWLLRSWKCTQAHIYWIWAVIVLTILADDALLLHEKTGLLLRDRFGPISFLWLTAYEIGQVMFWFVSGCFLIGLLGWGLRKTSAPDRFLGLIIGMPVLGIAFFGAAVDMLNHAFEAGSFPQKMMSVVEDGGEMVSVSFVCVAAYAISKIRNKASAD